MAKQVWAFRPSGGTGDLEVMWPRDLAGRFDESELVGQFRLSESMSQVPAGWQQETLGSWHLVHDAALPVASLIADGSPVGWILGRPITERGSLLAADLEVSQQGRPVDADSVQDLLDGFAGRFVAIIVGLNDPRIYLDALGSMMVVFSASQRVAASSAFLIPYSSENDDRIAFARDASAPARPTDLYFGLTVRTSVNWLLPNHYLHLATWQAVRHWPQGEIPFTTESGDAVDFVAERLLRNIRAVMETGRVQMALTAGMDTRVLLACARELIPDVDFYTDAFSDYLGRTDVSVARYIARQVGLHHRVVARRVGTDLDMARFLYRTGGSGGSSTRAQRIMSRYPQANVATPTANISGWGGEMDRNPSRFPHIDGSEILTISRVFELRKQAATPEVVERGARWLDDLPAERPHTVMDFRTLEIGFGSWGGFFPANEAGFSFPFADRRLLETLISLPVSYRARNGVVIDIVGSRWPELLKVPFNDPRFGPYGWYRRARRFAKLGLKKLARS